MSENIRIETPGGRSRVELTSAGRAVGIWAVNDRGSVGLVAEDGVAPYLVVHGAGSAEPALAIAAGEAGGAVVQVPGPMGLVDVRVVPFSRILDLLGPPDPA